MTLRTRRVEGRLISVSIAKLISVATHQRRSSPKTGSGSEAGTSPPSSTCRFSGAVGHGPGCVGSAHQRRTASPSGQAQVTLGLLTRRIVGLDQQARHQSGTPYPVVAKGSSARGSERKLSEASCTPDPRLGGSFDVEAVLPMTGVSSDTPAFSAGVHRVLHLCPSLSGEVERSGHRVRVAWGTRAPQPSSASITARR